MIARLVDWLEERLITHEVARKVLRKAFPDHWSFMLGEINLYAFAVLLITGTWLAFFFNPAHAYNSVLHISFNITGGLFIRQMHHWAALVFIAGIAVHMARVFFTGAFRRPREITWMVGVILLGLALFEGFAGYSLPDDLLSGLGLRIAYSVMLSLPVIGTHVAFWATGGTFPSEQLEPRLFILHVYMVPVTIAALIALHLLLIWHQKHTQFPGPGRTETHVIGSPLYPNYTLRTLSLLFGVIAVLALLGTFVQINPVWIYGKYTAWQAISPAQPDWYLSWVDGALRLAPPWALHIFGYLVPPVFWAGVFVPTVFMGIIFFWPFIEQLVTKDTREHHLLDAARNAPLRTAIGAGLTTFVAMLLFAGSDDVQARYSNLSVIELTVVYRFATIVAPFVAAAIAYAIARHLQRRGVEPAERMHVFRGDSGGYEEKPVA